MTRGACLLLLLLSSWLWSMPALRVQSPSPRAPVIASNAGEAHAAAASHHVTLPPGLPEVPRAPLLARLPVPQVSAAARRLSRELARPTAAEDLREALRRVQIRRRLPRLGGDDPPWC